MPKNRRNTDKPLKNAVFLTPFYGQKSLFGLPFYPKNGGGSLNVAVYITQINQNDNSKRVYKAWHAPIMIVQFIIVYVSYCLAHLSHDIYHDCIDNADSHGHTHDHAHAHTPKDINFPDLTHSHNIDWLNGWNNASHWKAFLDPQLSDIHKNTADLTMYILGVQFLLGMIQFILKHIFNLEFLKNYRFVLPHLKSLHLANGMILMVFIIVMIISAYHNDFWTIMVIARWTFRYEDPYKLTYIHIINDFFIIFGYANIFNQLRKAYIRKDDRILGFKKEEEDSEDIQNQESSSVQDGNCRDKKNEDKVESRSDRETLKKED